VIIGRDFVFVLPPKCASSSITAALMGHGVHTLHRQEPLRAQPPHPIVAAVVRPFEDMLASALHHDPEAPWVAYGDTDIRDVPRDLWLRFVNFPLAFDNLQADWERFCNSAGFHVDLPHLNRKKN